MAKRISKVRVVDTDTDDKFNPESGKVPRTMTWREYCFYSDEGLTVQEIKFADAYTDTPDPVKAAIAADVSEEKARGWAKFA
jgi:hypothetical protein